MTTKLSPADQLQMMQANLEAKQAKHRLLMEQSFDINDAVFAMDSVLTKLKGVENKALKLATELAMELLVDQRETLSERITDAIRECVEQDRRINDRIEALA